jgi:hypothetical protein
MALEIEPLLIGKAPWDRKYPLTFARVNKARPGIIQKSGGKRNQHLVNYGNRHLSAEMGFLVALTAYPPALAPSSPEF